MNNYSITNIIARQILDSRGNPTVEADVFLSGGSMGRAAVPSGASTGSGEALELRDGDTSKYGGKGVLKAVANVGGPILEALRGKDASGQNAIDQTMISLDGTDNKSNLGANAILAVSIAAAKAVANQKEIPLYQHFAEVSGNTELLLPRPMMNVSNGGMHADWATDIQEFMIMPISTDNINDTIRVGAEIFHTLGKIMKSHGYKTTVGDEGGYAPNVKEGNEEPFRLIVEAITTAGYTPGKDVVLLSDPAASEFYSDGIYDLKTENKKLTGAELITYYHNLIDKYPIVSIEDGFAENDWDAWKAATAELGNRLQLVGDDLLVTNPKLLQRAIDEKACNSILIKVNQIGTISESIEAIKLAKRSGFTAIVSHRSGETEDTTIAHLAVGLGTGQIKTGSMSRSERVAKYNELLRIAESNPSIKLANPFK